MPLVRVRENESTVEIRHRCLASAPIYAIVLVIFLAGTANAGLLLLGKGVSYLPPFRESAGSGSVIIMLFGYVLMTVLFLAHFVKILKAKAWRTTIRISRSGLSLRRGVTSKDLGWEDLVSVDPAEHLLVFRDGESVRLWSPDDSPLDVDTLLEVVPKDCHYAKAIQEYRAVRTTTETLMLFLFGGPLLVACGMGVFGVLRTEVSYVALLAFVFLAMWLLVRVSRRRDKIREKWMKPRNPE